MNIRVDSDACIGCGICADKCPDIFELDGKRAVVKTPSSREDEACCRDVAESCPVNAIVIKE